MLTSATSTHLGRVLDGGYLEHLLDLLARQVDVELVEELQDLTDAQGAVAVLIRLRERRLQPRAGRHQVKVETKRGASSAPLPLSPRGRFGVGLNQLPQPQTLTSQRRS